MNKKLSAAAYGEFFREIKEQIVQSRISAARAVSHASKELRQLVAEISIGVATYQLYPQLPEEYRGHLPAQEEWQRLLKSTQADEDDKA